MSKLLESEEWVAFFIGDGTLPRDGIWFVVGFHLSNVKWRNKHGDVEYTVRRDATGDYETVHSAYIELYPNTGTANITFLSAVMRGFYSAETYIYGPEEVDISMSPSLRKTLAKQGLSPTMAAVNKVINDGFLWWGSVVPLESGVPVKPKSAAPEHIVEIFGAPTEFHGF
jgi:hypothetical protein